MSEEKVSDTEMVVYVRLLCEGTHVFRPTKARKMTANTAKLLLPDDYDPEDEEWEFKPGSVVRLEERKLNSILEFVAVALASTGA